jgi:hypothetical protein
MRECEVDAGRPCTHGQLYRISIEKRKRRWPGKPDATIWPDDGKWS